MAIGLNSPLIINGQEVYPQVTPKEVKGLIDFIYPVGSIYISVNDTNPHDLFGGTWERIQDRFLLSAGDKYTSVGATGGEETHTLTVDEMPNHFHGAAKYFAQSQGIPGVIQAESDTLYQEENQITPGFYYSSKTLSAGGSQPHNNMPPYLIVYMWKRTA